MKKTGLTIFVALLIGGSIYLLESRKAERPASFSDSGASDIKIEDLLTEDATEAPSEATSTQSVAPEGESTTTSTVSSETERIPDEPEAPPALSALSEREARIAEKAQQYERAKEISTPDGFINTEPITVSELIGKKVILVDFWTYSCINCQRTLPYLNSWHEKYADDGLVILGIHTPEFDFEKDYENVERATDKFGVEHPVILDNDFSTWTAYKNRYWPRKYLIDIDGFIVYDHIGEGGYEETEAKIVELLNERSETLGTERVSLDTSEPEADTVDFSQVKTPETYLGYGRSQYLVNLPSSECKDKTCTFEVPDELSLNTYAFAGEWLREREHTTLESDEGELVIRFSANKANLVAGVPSGESVSAQVFLDGEPIGADARGSDVGDDGIVEFGEHGLYNLVDLGGDYSEHELMIKFESEGVQVFAFTFG